MRTARGALAVIALLAAGACGGGDDNGGAGDGQEATGDGSTTTTTISVSGVNPGAAGQPGAPAPGRPGAAPPAGSPGSSGDSSGGSGGSTTPTTKPPLEMSAELAEPCVRPGGRQTITVRAPKETPVGYGSEYSDGKTGMDPGFYGGANAGTTAQEGVYRDAWTIAANAPKGTVKVKAFGANPNYQLAERVVTYEVADPVTGKCS